MTTNGKILKQSRDHNHAPFVVIGLFHPVARIDVAYLCTKFDDFRPNNLGQVVQTYCASVTTDHAI